jgi:hypothetical protein
MFFSLFILGVSGFQFPLPGNQVEGGVGGGNNCLWCTIVMTVVEQLAVLHDKPVEHILDFLCDILPPGAKQSCEYFVDTYGAAVILAVESGLNPDGVCNAITLCTEPKCHLWPPGPPQRVRVDEAMRKKYEQMLANKRNAKQFDPWAWLQVRVCALSCWPR